MIVLNADNAEENFKPAETISRILSDNKRENDAKYPTYLSQNYSNQQSYNTTKLVQLLCRWFYC